MKIGYLLSAAFPYHKLLCPDAGPAVAEEYGWHSCTLDQVKHSSFQVIIVDNRHHDSGELATLFAEIISRNDLLFLLRVNDPCFFHASDPWYRFCNSLLGVSNVHFLTPYQPTGILSSWLASSVTTKFVYAPFTYDIQLEHVCLHRQRSRRVAVSGNQRRDLYPVRFGPQRISKFKIGRACWATERLIHPGYPEKCTFPAHSITGSSYVQWLSRFTAAFTDSSIYRIELLKFREIAYAGCAPIGDLPWSLFDCPQSAFHEYRGLADLFCYRRLLMDPDATEAIAMDYRHFMRQHRDRAIWRQRVADSIGLLL